MPGSHLRGALDVGHAEAPAPPGRADAAVRAAMDEGREPLLGTLAADTGHPEQHGERSRRPRPVCGDRRLAAAKQAPQHERGEDRIVEVADNRNEVGDEIEGRGEIYDEPREEGPARPPKAGIAQETREEDDAVRDEGDERTPLRTAAKEEQEDQDRVGGQRRDEDRKEPVERAHERPILKRLLPKGEFDIRASTGVPPPPTVWKTGAGMVAVVLKPGDGETLEAPNAPTVVHKVRGEATGGRLAIVEYVAPPGFAGPAVHHHELEESFYVLEGMPRLRVADEDAELAPGSFAHVPGGVSHSFWNPSDRPARFLITMAPAGFEVFFDEAMREARRAGGVPPPNVMARLNASHGVEVVGPPPGAA